MNVSGGHSKTVRRPVPEGARRMPGLGAADLQFILVARPRCAPPPERS